MSDSLRTIRSFLLKFVVIYIVYRLINLLVLEVLYNVGLQTYVESISGYGGSVMTKDIIIENDVENPFNVINGNYNFYNYSDDSYWDERTEFLKIAGSQKMICMDNDRSFYNDDLSAADRLRVWVESAKMNLAAVFLPWTVRNADAFGKVFTYFRSSFNNDYDVMIICGYDPFRRDGAMMFIIYDNFTAVILYTVPKLLLVLLAFEIAERIGKITFKSKEPGIRNRGEQRVTVTTTLFHTDNCRDVCGAHNYIAERNELPE